MEEALRCRVVGAVIGEIRTRAVEQIVMRRLSLAAAASGTLGVVLRPLPDNEPSTFATRWIIEAAPIPHFSSSQKSPGIGPPRLAARLVATGVDISENGSWSGAVWSSVSSSQRIRVYG